MMTKSRNKSLRLLPLPSGCMMRMDLLPVMEKPVDGVPVEGLKARVEVSVNAAAASADLYLFGYIASWGDVSARNMKIYLDDFKAKKIKKVNMKLNSNGGNVFEGNAIYNMIVSFCKENGVQWDVEVVGIAASMASVLMFCGGKPPKIAARSVVMIHGPRVTMDDATIEKVEATLDMQKQINESFVGLFMAQTKNTDADIRSWLKQEKWFSADQAKQFGFASEVTNTEVIESCVTESIAASLKMNIPAEFKTFITAVNPAPNPKQQPMETTPEKTEKSPDQLRIEALEQEHAKLQAEMKKNKASALVTAHATRLKLTAEQVASYTALAESDFNNTETLLKSMQAPVTISNQINNKSPEVTDDVKKTWTFEDWSKKDNAGLLEMREKNPDQFNALLSADVEKRKKG